MLASNVRPQRSPSAVAAEVPSLDLDRVLELIGFAYEAACDAADSDLVDWSLIGEPLAEALAILRRGA